MNSVLLKYGIAIAVIVLSFSSGWLVHGWKYDAEQFEAAKKLAIAVSDNDRLKTELGVKHENERKEIADAAATLAAGRVRLPKGCIKSDSTAGSAVPATATGELPDANQQALDRFKRGVDEVARDADELLATCRVVMEWAKVQGLPD